MKLRNCRWVAGLPAYNEPAITFVPARPAHDGSCGRSCGCRLIRTRQHYYHSGGSPQFITDVTWHSCMPVPGGHASKPTAGLTASSAGCTVRTSGGHLDGGWVILLTDLVATLSYEKYKQRMCSLRHVCLPTYISISEGHTCRSLSNLAWEVWQSVGCSDVPTEDVTDGRTVLVQKCVLPTACSPKWYSLPRRSLFCISMCTFAEDML